jgi:hypothetical protein
MKLFGGASQVRAGHRPETRKERRSFSDVCIRVLGPCEDLALGLAPGDSGRSQTDMPTSVTSWSVYRVLGAGFCIHSEIPKL